MSDEHLLSFLDKVEQQIRDIEDSISYQLTQLADFIMIALDEEEQKNNTLLFKEDK